MTDIETEPSSTQAETKAKQMSEAIQTAEDIVGSLATKSKEAVDDATRLIDRGIEKAGERMFDLAEETARLSKFAENTIKRHPLAAVAIAAGAGAILVSVASQLLRRDH